ncbi:MAG: histidine kinase, partial [Zoogloeaceae bacterium]|jgi:two-component system sensor histidine kinase AlgZ|nr:histidine kinase [Zoogloeaceae bacterium]
VENAAWVELMLLINLPILALLRDLLWRCPPRLAQAITLLLVAVTAALLHDSLYFFALTESTGLWRPCLMATASAACLIFYFELRTEALSPRLEEARLSALNARIRPHFFFNALNTVLALIRSDPKGAENTLENLSELFRALLKTPRELVLLSEEIALGRQYLEIEKLRLGERLRVFWEIEALPEDTHVPPLILQPLLENAVYHGIEPSDEGGEIRTRISLADDFLQLEITNHIAGSKQKSAGNHMALENIRQRLALYYDMEARLERHETSNRYQVRIILPQRAGNPSLPE